MARARCPPEDCGGLEGFLGFLEATLDPSHQQHEETKVWYESFYGSPFDLEEFDERRVRMDVNLIARGRRGTTAEPPQRRQRATRRCCGGKQGGERGHRNRGLIHCRLVDPRYREQI